MFAVLTLLMGLQAEAGEPSVRQEGDTVVVVAVASAPAVDLRRILADPQRVQALFPDILDEQVELAADGCIRIQRRTRGLLRPFVLLARRCPTAEGYREELVSSDDFEAYTSEWVVGVDDAGATRVEYRIRTALDVPVPASAVTAAVRKSALRAVMSLVSGK
jgi:hypothetical protein